LIKVKVLGVLEIAGKESMLIRFWVPPVVKVVTVALVVLPRREKFMLELVREQKEIGEAVPVIIFVKTRALSLMLKVLVPPPVIVIGVRPDRINVPV
jgi:hypothetical protein